ncbi:ACT domain-containing protein [Candidatus Micrarchaeota archaeon]|nr:ACT domain-containing protein [Candidatus Micrarchaeota archaeon]
MKKENISELVWLYIKRRPFLKEIVREGIVNYSALARKISIEVFGSKKHQNAIKMALVRLTSKIREKEEDLESKILKVLKDSSISLKSKVAVVISAREIEQLKYLSYVESKDTITYVVEEKELENVRKSKNVLHTETNLNLITIHSPPALEEVPGVIAHILDALSAEGINIAEFVSCYTDTLLVIKQADTARAYEILDGLTS